MEIVVVERFFGGGLEDSHRRTFLLGGFVLI